MQNLFEDIDIDNATPEAIDEIVNKEFNNPEAKRVFKVLNREMEKMLK